MLRAAGARPRSLAGDAWRDAEVDALIERYVEWREECSAVETAYGRWAGSGRRDRALTYAAYHAALEREEKAATVYQSAVTRLAAAACGR